MVKIAKGMVGQVMRGLGLCIIAWLIGFPLITPVMAGQNTTPFGKVLLPNAGSAQSASQPTGSSSMITLAFGHKLTSAEIRLSDIFTNLPPGLDQPIMNAPEPGAELRLTIYQIKELARRFQLDFQPAGVTGELILARPGKFVAKADVMKLVEQSLMQQANQFTDTGEFSVTMNDVSDGLHLPEWVGSQAAIQNLSYDVVKGTFSAQLVVDSRDPKYGPVVLPIAGEAQPLVMVFVPQRTIERGELIQSQDFQTTMLPANQAKDYLVGEIGLDYQEAKVTLQVGKPLRVKDIQAARLVKRGEQVVLELSQGAMTLSVTAKALEAGEIGQVIRVRNESSAVVLDAEVIGAGRARVGRSAKLAAQ